MKIRNTKIQALAVFSALTVCTNAAVIGINFATNQQTDPTAAYTSTELGVTVSTWNYDGGPNENDWSGSGTTFLADGASIGIWHDAEGVWRNNTQAESSVLHGYLDDHQGGTAGDNQNFIHLTGLSAWLAATGDTEYRVTVLRSSDGATGWNPIEVTTGNVAGETGWTNNGTPTGGTIVSQSDIAGIDLGAQQARTYETPQITLDANGISLHYITTGGTGSRPRGSVAGIIIESVPEPSSTALLGLGGLALILRRKK